MAALMQRSTEMQVEASVKTEIFTVLISFTLLSILAVVFRLWARYRCTGFYGWDDWLVIAALLLCIVRMALSFLMLEAGLGWQPIVFEDTWSFKTIAKALFWDEGLYLLALGVIKTSILIMYYRVFPLRGFKIATWVVGGAVMTWTVGYGVLWVLQCRPLVHFWQPWTDGTCMNARTFVIINTIPRMILDTTIIVMPICQVWQLQMPRAQKTGLTCMFMLGSFALIPAIWRLVVVVKEETLLTTQSLKSLNEWSYIEVCVALISACLPTIRPLLNAFSGLTGFGWSHHGRETNGGNSEDIESGEQQSSPRPEATCRVVLLDGSSESELVVKQDGPCKGMVVMLSQIGTTGLGPDHTSRSNHDTC